MTYRSFLIASMALAGILVLPNVALAQLSPQHGPVNASADHSHMESDKQSGLETMYLDDRVEILQDGRRLRCDHAKLIQAPRNDGTGGKDVVQMECTGHVYYVTENDTARGDYGIYTKADDTLKVTGDVILRRGQSVGTGNLFIDHVNAGDMSLTSDANASTHGRVRAVMYPHEKDAPGTAPAAQNHP